MVHYRTQILVLGGGPAGGAAALELAQAGCDVVLLERQTTLGWKIGETLPPEARIHLQRLKHWKTFQLSGHRPCHGIISCWGSSVPMTTDFMMNPYGHGWQLDRAKFEGSLLQAAQEDGCQVFYGVEAQTVHYQSGEWRLETSMGEFQAEWILDCTGRKGILAANGLTGSFEQLQDYISLYCVVHSEMEIDQDGRTYVESHPFGWSYSALMPNGSRLIAFLTDRDLAPSADVAAEWLQQRIQEGSQINKLLAKYAYSPITNVHQVNATSGRYQSFVSSRWLLVGDAGMTFDPLSGWGSAKALISATAAVQMVLNGSNYQTLCEEIWASYLRQYRDYYLAERRWPHALFWSRRHQLVLT